MNTRRPVLHDYGGGEMLDYDHSVVPATEADDPAQLIEELWVNGKFSDILYVRLMDVLEPEDTVQAQVHRAVTWCFGAAQPILQYAEYVKASYELARVQLWSNPVVAAMSRLRTIIS